MTTKIFPIQLRVNPPESGLFAGQTIQVSLFSENEDGFTFIHVAPNSRDPKFLYLGERDFLVPAQFAQFAIDSNNAEFVGGMDENSAEIDAGNQEQDEREARHEYDGGFDEP